MYSQKRMIEICNYIRTSGKYDNEITTKIKILKKQFEKCLKIPVKRANCIYKRKHPRSIMSVFHYEKIPNESLIDILSTDYRKTTVTKHHVAYNDMILDEVNIYLEPIVDKQIKDIYQKIKEYETKELEMHLK
jgi:hypothetical protein